jgi:hypothetical protein
MKHAAIVAALLCASVSYAAPVARQGGDSVQLMDKPCTTEVLKVIPEQMRPQYRAAVATVGGKPYAACWMAVQSRGFVHLYYEDSDQGTVNFGDFKDEPGT